MGNEYSHLPTDAGEILDYIKRKEPTTLRQIQRDTSWMSPDKVFECVQALKDHGHITEEEAENEHGRVRDMLFFNSWEPEDFGGGSA